MRFSFMRQLSGLGLISLVLIGGCAPAVPMEFGMPQDQFNQLSASQQQAVIQVYNQKKTEEAKMQSFYNFLGTVGSVVHVNKTLSQDSSSSCSGNTCEGESSSTSFSIN